MIENTNTTDEKNTFTERRRQFRRQEDLSGLDQYTADLISTVADLNARLKALEDEHKDGKESLIDVREDIDNLKEVKTLVVAWSMVAGSVSALIYSNFTAFKKLFL